jgi:hypothetical protein
MFDYDFNCYIISFVGAVIDAMSNLVLLLSVDDHFLTQLPLNLI